MNKIKKYLPYIILLIGAIILTIRAFYSFCWSDETFYSSTAYRFFMGDRVFMDEWFPTQLSGLIILPFVALFKLFTGSTDGLILFLRIVYVVFSYIVSCIIYYVFSRDKNKPVAYAVSVMMLFYTHLNIATLSYYTISVECFLLAVVLIYHYLNAGYKGNLVIAGISFALSVLALPTMAIAYFLGVFGVAVIYLYGHLTKNAHIIEVLNRLQIGNVILYSFSGIAIPAAFFFIFLLGNVEISDFIRGIPYVLSDDEHGTSLIFPLRKFFISQNEIYHKGAYASYLLILVTAFGKKFLSKKPFREIIFALDALLAIYLCYLSLGHTGYIQTVLAFTAVPLYFLTQKRDKKLFFTVFFGGMIFSLVYSYSSNGFLYVLSMGHAIASVAGICILYDFINELQQEDMGHTDRKSAKAVSFVHSIYGYLAAVFVCYVLATTCFLRIVNIYRDAPLDELTVKIAVGPAKGLYTTPLHNSMYEDVYEVITTQCTRESLHLDSPDNDNLDGVDISFYDNAPDSETLLISKLLPFGYLCTDLRVAAPTTWRVAWDSQRLREYYELCPEKEPSVILLLNEEYGTYDTCGDVEYDPNPNANETEGFLAEYVKTHNFSCKDVSCGKLYTR